MTKNMLIDESKSPYGSHDNLNDDRSKAILNEASIKPHITDKMKLPSKVLGEPGSRIAFLERSLRFIQQQQESLLVDLHNEIGRLQQENRDLHGRTTKLASIEIRQKDIDQLSSSSTSKTALENQHHLKQQIAQLEKQLAASELENKSLMATIGELTRIISSKSDLSNANNFPKDDHHLSIPSNECQDVLSLPYDKEQQYIHEIVKLQSVLFEILNTDQLNITSRILIRDCLTSNAVVESSMSKNTTTPVDITYAAENQQLKTISSPSTSGKIATSRPKMPVRSLVLSPPQAIIPKSTSQPRSVEPRISLPPIMRGNSSAFLRSPTDTNILLNNLMNTKADVIQYPLLKVGETPIARRERATQELQKNRLLKTLYH